MRAPEGPECTRGQSSTSATRPAADRSGSKANVGDMSAASRALLPQEFRILLFALERISADR